jgi:hypothetical protein
MRPGQTSTEENWREASFHIADIVSLGDQPFEQRLAAMEALQQELRKKDIEGKIEVRTPVHSIFARDTA